MRRVWSFVEDNSLLLVIGACTALLWANIDPEHYQAFHKVVLIENSPIGHLHGDGAWHTRRMLTLHYLVNDVLMAFFFAIAGKEVWEAIALKNGSLKGKKAATPLIATLGGMIGPIIVYLGIASLMGSTTLNAVANGWAVPTATDIAFSYLVGRLVFGAGHPAVRFLLLLAIADDAGGLLILAVFYPSADLALEWLLLSAAAAVLVYLVFNLLPRRLDAFADNDSRPYSSAVRKYLGVWPYAIAAAISWYAFQESGIHPALGLLPIIPAIPHADVDFGFFSEEDKHATDLLNVMEHRLSAFVHVVLFFFGLINAGVEFSAVGEATWLVVLGLVIGKPLGIFCLGWIAARVFKLGLPEGMRIPDLFVLGCVAAIGFTVALFVASVAFEPGAIQDAAKMGALMSFGAGLLAIVFGRIFAVERVREYNMSTQSV